MQGIFKLSKLVYLLKTLGISLAITFSLTANATLIEVKWSATVTSSGVSRVIDIGDTITGHYAYDDRSTTTWDTMSEYVTHNTMHSSYFSVNGLNGMRTENKIGVFNNRDEIGDQFDSRGGNWRHPRGEYTGDLLSGFSVSSIFVRFNDSTSRALSDLSLPSILDDANFDFGQTSRLNLDDGSRVEFIVDSFTMSSAKVPEPSTFAIFALGMIGLASRRFKKQA